MSKLIPVFLLLTFLFLTSCAAKKKAAELEAQPVWMKQKPQIDGYFTGVGSAMKIGTPKEYIAHAKNDALADLAGEVSVQISASSVLHTIETQYGNTDFFDQRIETQTEDYLEGFEPVDSYDTEDSYWMYYRIPKSTYYDNKARRKADAIAHAKAKYLDGGKARKALNPKGSIAFYLKGLSAIRPYLAEETPANVEGKNVDIGSTLYTALEQAITDLSIETMTNEYFVKHGQSAQILPTFKVTYRGQLVNGIPVDFKFSGGYLDKNNAVTDSEGKAFVDIGIIHSKKAYEQLTASINLQELANKATEDLFIRGLLSNRQPPSAKVKIIISLPKLLLTVNEDFCQTSDCESIQQLFENNVLQAGYLMGTPEMADYNFKLQLQLEDGETSGSLTSVLIKGQLNIYNSKSHLIWTKTINEVESVGDSLEEANEKAFTTLQKNLNLLYFRQALETID